MPQIILLVVFLSTVRDAFAGCEGLAKWVGWCEELKICHNGDCEAVDEATVTKRYKAGPNYPRLILTVLACLCCTFIVTWAVKKSWQKLADIGKRSIGFVITLIKLRFLRQDQVPDGTQADGQTNNNNQDQQGEPAAAQPDNIARVQPQVRAANAETTRPQRQAATRARQNISQMFTRRRHHDVVDP